MKRLLLFFILHSFFHKTNAQTIEQKINVFAKSFIHALATENIDSMIALKPSPAIWRSLMPAETKKMSDNDINKAVNSNEKFIIDFNNIIQSAKDEKVNLKALTFTDAKFGESIMDGKILSVEIKYKYLVKDEVIFSLTIVEYQNKYYLYDILMSYQIFKRYYFNR